MMNEMNFKMPTSLNELALNLDNADEKTYLISGGTDLIIKLREKKIYSGTIIDLKGIQELNYIRQIEQAICIGANTTFTEMIHSEILIKNAPCLVQAAEQIGSTQIRNAATIGGNIANAFAGADAIPALIAMGVKVKIMNATGEFFLKDIDEVVIGSGENSLHKDEVITEVIAPVLGHGYKSFFGKIGSRERVTIAKLNMAVVVKNNHETGVIEEAKVVLGSLGPKAFRSDLVETGLVGKHITDSLQRAFEKALIGQIDISIAGRSSRPYKREAVKALSEDAFSNLFGSPAWRCYNEK